MRRAVAGAPFLDAAPGTTPDGATHQPTAEGETGMNDDGNAYLSTPKAAAFLGLSPRTMDRYRMAGEGPSYYCFGHRVLYRRADLEDWAEARRVRNWFSAWAGVAGSVSNTNRCTSVRVDAICPIASGISK